MALTIPTPKVIKSTTPYQVNHDIAFDFLFPNESGIVREVIFLNEDTDNGYAFRIESKESEEHGLIYFVSVRCHEQVMGYIRGIQTYTNYAFMGTVFDKTTFKKSSKTRVEAHSVAFKAFCSVVSKLYTKTLPDNLKLYSEFFLTDSNTSALSLTRSYSDRMRSLRIGKTLHQKNIRRFYS